MSIIICRLQRVYEPLKKEINTLKRENNESSQELLHNGKELHNNEFCTTQQFDTL